MRASPDARRGWRRRWMGSGSPSGSGCSSCRPWRRLGCPTRFASATAMYSMLGSTMKSAAGSLVISLMPPKWRLSRSISSSIFRMSFFGHARELAALHGVLEAHQVVDAALDRRKFVSVPPSQRLLTKGMPQRPASDSMVSCACFLVPTNRMVPPWLTSVSDPLARLFKAADRLLQVDDVDAVTLGEYEGLHARVPAPCLVTEVRACLEQGFHAYSRRHYIVVPLVRSDRRLLPRPGLLANRPANDARNGASPAPGGLGESVSEYNRVTSAPWPCRYRARPGRPRWPVCPSSLTTSRAMRSASISVVRRSLWRPSRSRPNEMPSSASPARRS